MADIRAAALAYVDGWKRKDAKAIAELLAPEVSFIGPTAGHKGRDAVLASFQPLFPILSEVVLRNLFVEAEEAVLVYDFVFVEPIGSIRMAELIGFEDGRAKRIEMFFDPQPFLVANGVPQT